MTSTNSKTAKATSTESTEAWQDTLAKSTTLKERGAKQNKQAGILLWSGAQAAIEEFLPGSDEDVSGETFYSDLVEALGKSRKADASKIKTVALAVKTKGLSLSMFPNLAQAYSEAVRLTTVAKKNETEDNAADEAIQRIAAEAPKSSSKPEGAIQIALAGGADDFARLVVDAVCGEGPQANLDAARAILRALSQEIAGRVPKPEPKPKTAKAPAKPKSGATKAKSGATKAKPAATKAKPVARKKTAVEQTSDALVGTDDVEADLIEEDVADVDLPDEDDDMFDALDDDEDEAEANAVSVPEVPVKKASPVKRPAVKGRPVKRG